MYILSESIKSNPSELMQAIQRFLQRAIQKVNALTDVRETTSTSNGYSNVKQLRRQMSLDYVANALHEDSPVLAGLTISTVLYTVSNKFRSSVVSEKGICALQ